MARISLWKPYKDRDYHFGDKALKDYVYQGGTGVYLHKYIGPAEGGNESTIQDVLFLENRSRKYDNNIYEMRGTYQPQSSEFDLSQFGIFISNDTIAILFHYNDMLEKLGRKIMAGDVIELPHLADPDTLNEDANVTHRFYVVEETMHASEGYGNSWWSHLWRVRSKQMINSQEYSGIIAADTFLDLDEIPEFTTSGTIINSDGEVAGEICCDNDNSSNGALQDITDGIIAEAYSEVRFDPKQYDAAHIWVYQGQDGYYRGCTISEYHKIPWSSDGIPPNGQVLGGKGIEFPIGAINGTFYLRTDFDTPRLFMKDGDVWKLIEVDFRKVWTAYNKVLDTFIDNVGTDTLLDGSVVKTKKALSKVVKPKVNLHLDKENELRNNNDGNIQ